jgi:16S rRNA processing protein RimM
LLRVWGNRGALSAVPFGRGVEGYAEVREVVVCGPGAGPVPLPIEWVREHRGRLIFKFRGVDSITEAEQLAGAEVRVPHSERRALPLGEYYQSELVGCQVVECRSGQPLGVVTGWQEFGAAPLLEVDTGAPGEPLLVPFARSVCVEIDPAGRRIVVELPEGLKELKG